MAISRCLQNCKMTDKEIKVPNIGEFKNVEVIEVLVSNGQSLSKNDPLITIESDKSSVEIPSSVDGKIKSVKIKVGDKVSQGDLILTLEESKKEKTEVRYYTVQIGLDDDGEKTSLNPKLDIHKVWSSIIDGMEKYFYGCYETREEADSVKTWIREKEIKKDAFIPSIDMCDFTRVNPSEELTPVRKQHDNSLIPNGKSEVGDESNDNEGRVKQSDSFNESGGSTKLDSTLQGK